MHAASPAASMRAALARGSVNDQRLQPESPAMNSCARYARLAIDSSVVCPNAHYVSSFWEHVGRTWAVLQPRQCDDHGLQLPTLSAPLIIQTLEADT
eukprot:364429-Chlamydomonas_euryale.AAC.3